MMVPAEIQPQVHFSRVQFASDGFTASKQLTQHAIIGIGLFLFNILVSV